MLLLSWLLQQSGPLGELRLGGVHIHCVVHLDRRFAAHSPQLLLLVFGHLLSRLCSVLDAAHHLFLSLLLPLFLLLLLLLLLQAVLQQRVTVDDKVVGANGAVGLAAAAKTFRQVQTGGTFARASSLRWRLLSGIGRRPRATTTNHFDAPFGGLEEGAHVAHVRRLVHLVNDGGVRWDEVFQRSSDGHVVGIRAVDDVRVLFLSSSSGWQWLLLLLKNCGSGRSRRRCLS